jgi:excisionase family DNA binding protein
VPLQTNVMMEVAKMRDRSVTNFQPAAISQWSGKSLIPNRRLLRLKAAAEYLSLSPWKLRQLIQCGKLPVIQDTDGSPFLLDVRDLDGWLERNKRTSLP